MQVECRNFAIIKQRRGKLCRGVLFHENHVPLHKIDVAITIIFNPNVKEQLRDNNEENIEVINHRMGKPEKQFSFQRFQAL